MSPAWMMSGGRSAIPFTGPMGCVWVPFTPSDIRDGTILETVGLPKDQVIAIPRHLDRQGSLSGGPADHIDDVRAVAVDDYSGALMLQIVDTSANELVPLWFKVGDDR